MAKHLVSRYARTLRGPRFDVRRRGLARWRPWRGRETVRRIVVNGVLLTEPESFIYDTLVAMRLNFSAQVAIGGGRVLGGGLVDFLLHDYNIDLDYVGPFHRTTEGAVRDFWRRATRLAAGITTVYLYDSDLKEPGGQWSRPRLISRLREIIGSPIVASIITRS